MLDTFCTSTLNILEIYKLWVFMAFLFGFKKKKRKKNLG